MEIVDFIRADANRPLCLPERVTLGRAVRKLGLIAGGGALPLAVARHCQAARPAALRACA